MAVTFVSTHDNGAEPATGTVVVAGVPGGTDRLYIATMGVQNGTPGGVASVTGGGLTWNSGLFQCAGRNQAAIEVWWAFGSPAGFSVTVVWSSPDDAENVIIDVFDGADSSTPVRNFTGQNTNGVLGACSGGTDDGNPKLDPGITVDNPAASIVFAAAQYRNRTLVQDPNFTTRGDRSDGSGGDESHITTSTRANLVGSPQVYSATFSSGVQDWATIGFEIVAAGVTMCTFASVLGTTLVSGAGVFVKGSFVQFTFNAKDTKWLNVMINAALNVATRLDVANFAGTVIYSDLRGRVHQSAGDRTTPQVISVPLDLGATSGVSLRISDNSASAFAYTAHVWLSDTPFQRATPTMFQHSGTKSPGFGGPSSGAVAFTFGAFTELIPALSFEPTFASFQFFRNFTGGGSENMTHGFQIATGAAGNEVVQMDTIGMTVFNVSSGKLCQAVYDVPVKFTSGERLSVRVNGTLAGVRDLGFGVSLSG